MAFEQGRLKFEAPKKTMKIDGHPFATNMVDVATDEGSSQAKILTSSSAKIAASKAKADGESASNSSTPIQAVGSLESS